MTAADFADFFRAVHDGYDPFRWQSRLAAQVMESGEWPKVIAAPTGTGKTSALDIAVFHLALEAGKNGAERRAPLRTFFVIDRRLVVDDVAQHARKLRDALQNPASPIVKEVAARLLWFGTGSPLEVAVLRGGMYRSDILADQPNQPLVCATTVDQAGSRLLFRGYGVSGKRQPIHAGLLGMDSLLIVDEAHLSRPFSDTLEQLQYFQGEAWRQVEVGQPLRSVQMTATPTGTSPRFELDAEDLQDGPLQARLLPKKIADLRETTDFVSDAVREARRLAAGPDVVVTGIVANTVGTARAIFTKLRDEQTEAILLTGRVRPYDRDKVLRGYLPRIAAKPDREAGVPLFVVATQTIEVGADLDFDALVTEAAPIDSLRQRFGRLNRLGRRPECAAVVLKPKRTKVLEMLYGEPLEKTWEWLKLHAEQSGLDKRIDFGVQAMSRLFADSGGGDLVATSEPGPALLPAFLDSWVQTHPQPQPDPDVAPFLHGRQALESADVQLVWRADLKGNGEDWIEILSAVPPTIREALPLRLSVARRWLRRETADVADIEGYPEEAGKDQPASTARNFVLWRGPENSIICDGGNTGREVRPGDTIALPSVEGGCDKYGWDPASTAPVPDIGDLCANERAAQDMGRYRLRIHPDVLFESGEERDELRSLLSAEEEDEDPDWSRVRALVESSRAVRELEPDVRPRLDVRRASAYGGGTGLLWVDRERRKPRKDRIPSPIVDVLTEDSDEDDGAQLAKRVTLSAHTAGVHALAAQYGRACGLSAALASDVELAARLHDIGKADERFQTLLGRRSGEEPLGKGIGNASYSEELYRREQAGYPKGARHEFTSVALAAGSKALAGAHDPELVLHLIGTHHGFGRSLPPFWLEENDFQVHAQVGDEVRMICRANQIARVDSGWPDRFWSLVETYGYWGLAYLEAILRRADCVRSRREEEESGNGGV